MPHEDAGPGDIARAAWPATEEDLAGLALISSGCSASSAKELQKCCSREGETRQSTS